jgi:hypothetical protein
MTRILYDLHFCSRRRFAIFERGRQIQARRRFASFEEKGDILRKGAKFKQDGRGLAEEGYQVASCASRAPPAGGEEKVGHAREEERLQGECGEEKMVLALTAV